MGPFEPPTTIDLTQPRIQDVSYVNAEWLAFEHFITDFRKGSVTLDSLSKAPQGKGDTIADLGQIEKMTLPQGWEEGKPTSGGIGTRSFREVHPAEFPDAKLCFYYRGLPASDDAGKAFKNVLDQPAHILSKAEIDSLGEILRGKNDPETFNPLMIKTEDLNGKRVLTVNGRLTEKQADLKEILVDADGTGKAVQEIYFQAPKELYMRYMKAAQEAMQTIEWK
jgi:hypothetical protein